MAKCQQEYESKVSEFFDQADQAGDGNGTLSRMEFCKIIKKCGCKEEIEVISGWFDECDTVDDDKISKEEFMSFINRRDPKSVEEDTLRTAFKDLDKDGSGFITVEDMQIVMDERGISGEATLGGMDTDENGRVSYEEFLKIFQ
nr:calmodulin [Crepidula fornicata]